MKPIVVTQLLAVLLALVTQAASLRAETANADADAPTSVVCIYGAQNFSIESPAQWKFDETQPLTNGRCVAFSRIFDSTSAEISVYAYASGAPNNVIHLLTGIADTDMEDVEQRKGDPLSIGGVDFTVLKYFPKTSGMSFVSVATSTSQGQSIYVALSAPDRAAHDRFYQTFRDTVRTIRMHKSGGVSH